MSDKRSIAFLMKQHGWSWLFSELSEDPIRTDVSHGATVESIARIDGRVSQLVGEDLTSRMQRLESLKSVLEVRLEILQWWGGLIANVASLFAAFVALCAVVYGKSPANAGFIGFLALMIAGAGVVAKAAIERRRVWLALNLLAVKRLLTKK